MKITAITALALSTVLAVCLLLFGGSFSAEEKSTKEEKNDGAVLNVPEVEEEKLLTLELGPDPECLDPALCVSRDGCNILLHLFESLTLIDGEGNVLPGAAEKWEMSEDGLTWTFHLRSGLKWSDGTALTAGDFVFSWKRLVTTEKSNNRENLLNNVEGYSTAKSGNGDALSVSAPDDLTFRVKLSAPCPDFASLVSSTALCPLKKSSVGEGFGTTAEGFVSNGAFVIVRWDSGENVVCGKNVSYRDAENVTTESTKWDFCDSADEAYLAYQGGEALFTKEVPERVLEEGREDIYTAPIAGTYFLTINFASDPFWNADIRRGLSLAIDREYIVNEILGYGYTPAYNLLGPGWSDPAGGDFSENANGGETYISEDYAANLAEAKSLIENQGYSEFWPLRFSFMISNSDTGVKLAEYLKSAWEKVGAVVTLKKTDPAEFAPTRAAGDFDIAKNGWIGDSNSPYNLLSLFESGSSFNEGNYYSYDYYYAMSDYRAAKVAGERSALLHKAESIIMDEAGVIPIAYYEDVWMQNKRLTGVTHTPTGYWNFIYAKIEDNN